MFTAPHITRRVAALFLLVVTQIGWPAGAKSEAASKQCEQDIQLAALASPKEAWRGAPLRVAFSTEKALDGKLELIAPDGSVSTSSAKRQGGPPYFWFAEVQKPAPGVWRARLSVTGGAPTCNQYERKIAVHSGQPKVNWTSTDSVWPIRANWNRSYENLYSVWIEKLFDAPLDETLSWKALHEVLRDPSRNFLFNHLGIKEDQRKYIIRPDCADLPYFLRAYFAFKLGLPFGYSSCSRGGKGKAPQCYRWKNIYSVEEPQSKPAPKQQSQPDLFSGLFGQQPTAPPPQQRPKPREMGAAFGQFLRVNVANVVHSGSGRTSATDNRTDYYPVKLDDHSIRPGTVFADPYGHLLVIAKRVPQTGDNAGVLLAVDGQPDGTVARKRYWRGNFLFANGPGLGGPGFKRFRPIVWTGKDQLRRLTNQEIAKSLHYGDYSTEQSKLSSDAFYDRMDDIISPEPLDPVRAITEAITALEEQVNTRVRSVENGRQYQLRGASRVAMPNGASIFETTGPWEDYATPARDLRLLIAIDVVRKFPERVARRHDRYAMPKDMTADQVKAKLNSVLATELSKRSFSYKRSDGSDWSLTLKDVIGRAKKLEMAYNINDCVELRWGAAKDSKEGSTCKRQTSGTQRKKMQQYRVWFQERRRPPRG